jgi:signal transduction histidine kinase
LAFRGQVAGDGGGTGRHMLGVAVDVTERRRAEAAARDSLALLQSGLDALSARVAILDGTGRAVAVNAAWRRAAAEDGPAVAPGADYFGACDAHGRTWPEWARIGEGLRAVARGEVAEFRREHRGLGGAAGRERWFQLRATRFGRGEGLRLVVAHEDVTEVRRSGEALKAATERLLTLQDEERRRIARELHDTTVQDLAMAIVGLDLAAAAHAEEAPAAALAEARGLLERAVRDVRTLSYLLHPPLLDEFGLAVALETYAEGFARRGGVEVALDLDEAPPDAVPPATAVALFHVAQEAFANARRHGGARCLRLRLRVAAGDEAELRVEDDGRGFGATDGVGERGEGAPAELRSLGVGIPGMRARVRQLGGALRIETGAGGTRVTATVPLPLEGAPAAATVPGDDGPADAVSRPGADAGRDARPMPPRLIGRERRPRPGEAAAPPAEAPLAEPMPQR